MSDVIRLNLCNDMPQLYNNALIFLAILVCSSSLILWGLAFRRLWSGRVLLSFEPRQHVPWGLVDFLITITLLLMVSILLVVLVTPSGTQARTQLPTMADEAGTLSSDEELVEQTKLELEQTKQNLLIGSGSTAGLLIFVIILLKFRVGATWKDFGFEVSRCGEDLKLGIIAFAMLAPPMLLIQWVAIQWIEYEHKIVELLQQNSTMEMLAITAVAAMIVAPICEEFIFRVLLQGWLENVHNLWSDPAGLFYGARRVSISSETLQDDYSEYPDADTASDYLLHRPTQEAKWPIVASAAIFALMHLGQGPAPIPLFFLALGLGYLYQKTHRILPCMVVHFLVNTTSMAQLWNEILHQ